MNKATLSASDWAILRVLWEHKSLTSGELHEAIKDMKPWTITTLKTVLSRLRDKGYLMVDTTGRFPTYSCRFTEEECIADEMQQAVYRIYGDVLLHQAEHVDFYGHPDHAFVFELEAIVEHHYPIICHFLDQPDIPRVPFLLHRSLANMHSAMGLHDGPNWLRLGENYGIFHISPRHTFDDLPLDGAVSFMLANVMINQIHHGLPFYFKQGLATVLSSLDFSQRITSDVLTVLDRITPDTLMDLLVEEDQLGEMRQHEIAYLFVSFLLHHFGKQTIQDIVHRRQRLSVLVQSEPHIITKWKQHIQTTYFR